MRSISHAPRTFADMGREAERGTPYRYWSDILNRYVEVNLRTHMTRDQVRDRMGYDDDADDAAVEAFARMLGVELVP
jgi:hypothetical protein